VSDRRCRNERVRAFLAAVAVAGPALTVAQAQSLEEGLRACAAESDGQRRLACYDRLAVRGKPPPAVSDFGVRNGPLEARRDAAEPSEISAAVIRIDQRASGVLVFALDNGQTWMQAEAGGYFPLKVGDTVRIRSAALGSYMLLAPSHRFTRVTRIR
jgi:hypothetical protein